MPDSAPVHAPVKAHISLNVRDIDHSVVFYEAFFGVPAHKRRAGYANFDLTEPPLKVALVEGPVQLGVGALNHLGFQVATSAQVEAARASDRRRAGDLRRTGRSLLL